MIIIATEETKSKNFLPHVGIAENKEKLKQNIKRQLMEQIIENPETIKSYKTLKVYQIGELDKEFNIIKTDKKELYTYGDILNEIIKTITKEQKK